MAPVVRIGSSQTTGLLDDMEIMAGAGDLGVEVLDVLGVRLDGLGLIGGQVLLQLIGGVQDALHSGELGFAVLDQDVELAVGHHGDGPSFR